MKLKGYKGFNGDLQCTPNGKIFQYKIGGEYREENAELCKSGFHFCENPLDVFGYYPPSESRFCEVEAAEVSSKKDSDSKRSCKSIKIGAEISLKSMCDAAVKFIFERVDWSDKKATNTGDQSAATVSGSNSIAIVTGKNSYAKGAIGCWLVLTERNSDYEILGVKAVKVDGKKIKSDTFYELVNGKIIEKS